MVFGLNNKKNRKKKRLSPSALTPQSLTQQHPLYEYARREFGQAVLPGTSNDDGSVSLILNNNTNNTIMDGVPSSSWSLPSHSYGVEHPSNTPNTPTNNFGGLPHPPSGVRHCRSTDNGTITHITANSTLNTSPSKLSSDASNHAHNLMPTSNSHHVPHLPDTYYEEIYGPAYTGGTIKYVYPSGYQSMRPRSCPWKLSIVILCIFTWLSVFIVGHCSDQVNNQYNTDSSSSTTTTTTNSQVYNTQDFTDDDVMVIQMRWCGSRPLYLLWVTSMLITGLAASYTCVIGYIQLRDFAVANSRSQPPGVLEGQSDYYVKLGSDASFSKNHSDSHYQPTIYQSDGTPQFWGSHIYKPTQAAVAVTSR